MKYSIDAKFMHAFSLFCFVNFIASIITGAINQLALTGLYIVVWVVISVRWRIVTSWRFPAISLKQIYTAIGSIVVAIECVCYLYVVLETGKSNPLEIFTTAWIYPWEIDFKSPVFSKDKGRMIMIFMGIVIFGIYKALYALRIVSKPIDNE